MVNTRHYGIMGISATTIAQALGAACGDPNLVSPLNAGNISLIAFTAIDFIIARLRKTVK